MSREMFGPDVVASVTTAELAELIRGVRAIETMLAHPVDKRQADARAAPLREIFLKSVVPADDLPSGTSLDEDNITTKKPGTGISAARYRSLIGRRLVRDVKKDVPLVEQDLDG